MKMSVLFFIILSIFLFSADQLSAQELIIDPLCGEVGHSPCVPGLNAPLPPAPPKKTFEYLRIESADAFGQTPIAILDSPYSVTLGETAVYPLEIVTQLLGYSDEQKKSEVYVRERKLILRAYEDPDLIGNLSTDVFELALKNEGMPLTNLLEPLTITLPWPGGNYMKKVIHVWDGMKDEWRSLPSESNFEAKTVSARWPLPYGQFAVFDDHEVFEGIASWYAYKGCNCAAIKEYKRGTKVKVTNITDGSPRYGRSVNVTINDYGPAVWTKRAIDLDKIAFRQIANTWNGLAVVRVERIQ